MSVLTVWFLATTLLVAPPPGAGPARQIDVDCSIDGALERALARAEKLGEVDITLHGVCEGHFVVAGGVVTLRGATVDSGLAAPAEDPQYLPVLEVADARASLRELIVRGGVLGVEVHGQDSELFLFEVDVLDQLEVGVVVHGGASGRLWDTNVRDGFIGIVADSQAKINLQRVTVSGQDQGVIVTDGSNAALTETTIENNRGCGLDVRRRSEAFVYDGVFRENGEVHVHAVDWSSINLVRGEAIGSETDGTPHALGATRDSRISSYNIPFIHGEVTALDNGSIRLGSAAVTGNLIVRMFSDAHVRNSEITGIVYCADGAEAICSQTTSGGVIDCPSPTCGSAPVEAAGPPPPVPEFSVVELPGLERTPPTTPDRHR